MAYEPLKPETQEQYMKIWTHYAVAHFTQEQLAKLFGCSADTISNAIHWAAANRIKLETNILIEAAKEAIEAKLRDLANNILTIKGKEPANWNAIIGIEKIIFTYRELLWKLQGIIYDKSIVNIIEETPSRQAFLDGQAFMGGMTEAIKRWNLTDEERIIVADIVEQAAKRQSASVVINGKN